MSKFRILFLCVHNSARSQMAEAFLNKHGGGEFEVMSGGLEAGELNPMVVETMKEVGIDISGNKTKSVFDLYRKNYLFSYVIAVCDREAAERCPIFPGVTKRLLWPFPDPSKFTGTRDEILARTRTVRDQIEAKVLDFISKIREGGNFDKADII